MSRPASATAVASSVMRENGPCREFSHRPTRRTRIWERRRRDAPILASEECAVMIVKRDTTAASSARRADLVGTVAFDLPAIESQ